MLEMDPTTKLPNLKLTPDIEESAYRILDEYLMEMKIYLKLQTRSMQVGKGQCFREISSKASMGLEKTTTSRTPDLMLGGKQTKTIWIYDMAFPRRTI